MALKDLVYFKEKDNLQGKKDASLIVDCHNCPQKENDFFKSQNCLYCFLKILYNYRNSKFDYVSILSYEFLVKPDKFNIFFEYFKILKKVKRINRKIEKIREDNCSYKEFKCKIIPEFFTLHKIRDFEYIDPILVYNVFEKRKMIIKAKKIKDSICLNCKNNIEKSIQNILKILNNLEIIQKFKEFQVNNEKNQDFHSFYEFFFTHSPLLVNTIKSIQFEKKENKGRILTSYDIGKYNILKVSIYENSYEIEKKYTVDLFYKGEVREDYFEYIIQDIHQNLEVAEFDQLIALEDLIKIYKREALRIVNSKYNLLKPINKQLSLISVLKKINLEKLFPLLIDDFIEEIFLDSPKDEIYINHQKYGRCRTEISLNSKEIDRIKTFIRLYSGQRLDIMNPSIKFVIKNKYFYCRFSIDVEPIQINNFALDIRKLNKNILTIQDLLKNGTLDPLIASFLYFNILRRKNITVTGETDTGKTTLINALDMLTPKEFRKIYIENITESLNEFKYGKHQLKYRVDSLEESVLHNYSKSNQIKTLLHRTPDIIYLGEILTKDEAEAMFHCLAAGLRGFQTIHSRDIDSLMNRFLFHFKINMSCLSDLDLIVLMKKQLNERRVVGVFEICRSPNTNNSLYRTIFEYNPETYKWLLTKSIYETGVISDLTKYETLSKEKFLLYIKTFNEIFEFLLKNKKLSNFELVDLFHKISYNSLRSIGKIKQFWNKWKKNRSLNL